MKLIGFMAVFAAMWSLPQVQVQGQGIITTHLTHQLAAKNADQASIYAVFVAAKLADKNPKKPLKAIKIKGRQRQPITPANVRIFSRSREVYK